MGKWKHFLLVIGVLSLLGVPCFFLVRPAPRQPGISWGNLWRIQAGMSRKQVEELLGGLPQTEVNGSVPISNTSPAAYHMALLWSGAELDVWVYLNAEGRVMSREGIGSFQPSLLERLRIWLEV